MRFQLVREFALEFEHHAEFTETPCPQTALVSMFADLFNADSDGNAPLVVLGTLHAIAHPRKFELRLKQAVLLADTVATITNECAGKYARVAAVLSGDFNAEPNTDVYAALRKHALGLRSAYKTVTGSEPACTFRTTEGSATTDYIWAGRDLRAVSVRPLPVCDPMPNAREGSDHIALYADLQWQ